MKIAKRFRWEAAHRLPWHEGLCRNLHGHSYRMVVELEGEPDARGMVLDFQHLKKALAPLIDAWDHAILVDENDAQLMAVATQTGWKHAVLPFDTTAENLSDYVAAYLCEHAAEMLQTHRIRRVRVRLEETEMCYAEAERTVAERAVASEAHANGEAVSEKPASV